MTTHRRVRRGRGHRSGRAWLIACLAAGVAACGRPPVPPARTEGPAAAGLVTLDLDASGRVERRAATSSAPVPDDAVSVSAPASFPAITVRGERFIEGTFAVTARRPFANLTLYAVARPDNVGGTAVRRLTGRNGALIADAAVARAVTPAHGFDAARTDAYAVDAARADLQVLLPGEAEALTRAARASGQIGPDDTVLEYGFVARSTPDGRRAFAAGQSGQVTVAMRVPSGVAPERMQLTFVVVDDAVTRFTRGLEEGTDASSVADLVRRANAVGGDRELLIVRGPNGFVAGAGAYPACSSGSCRTVQADNVLVSTAPAYAIDARNLATVSGSVLLPNVTREAFSAASLGVPSGARFAPGQAIVKFREVSAARFTAQSLGATTTRLFGRTFRVQLAAGTAGTASVASGTVRADEFAAEGTLQLIARLRARPDVAYAEPNYLDVVAAEPVNDPLYATHPRAAPVSSASTGKLVGNAWHLEQARVPDAWAVTTGRDDVTVAVLDTGVLYDQRDYIGNDANGEREAATAPDLYCGPGGANRWYQGYNFVSYTVHDWDPDQAVESDDPFDPGPAEATGYHGSHVAGTIGACTNNGVGIAGVDWHARMLAVRVIGPYGGYRSDIIRGLLWAAGVPVVSRTAACPEGCEVTNPHPADVINMSLSGRGVDRAMQDAVDQVNALGRVVVVSAGNSNDNAFNYGPAGLNGVVTVGALGPGLRRAYYSNYGGAVEVSAPGGDLRPQVGAPNGVLSVQGCGEDGAGTVDPVTGCGDAGWSYAEWQGTSQAAPHVTGVIALMDAARLDRGLGKLNAADATRLLQATAIDVGDAGHGCALGCGAGEVDAAAAVSAAGVVADAPGGYLSFLNPIAATGSEVAGLDFGAEDSEGEVSLENGGPDAAGFELTTSMPSLRATVNGASAGSVAGRSRVTVRVVLDRDAQADGAYVGSVFARNAATGQTTVLAVFFSRGHLPADVGRMRIELRSATNAVVARVVTPFVAGQGYAYRFTGVPGGRYAVVAAVDADADGASEFYRCYPRSGPGGCDGSSLAVNAAEVRHVEPFALFPHAVVGIAPY